MHFPLITLTAVPPQVQDALLDSIGYCPHWVGQLQMFKLSLLSEEDTQPKPAGSISGKSAGECECPPLWDETDNSLDDEMISVPETVK